MPKIAKEIKEDKYREHGGDLISRFVTAYLHSPDWVPHTAFIVFMSVSMFVVFHDHLGF